MAIPMRMGRRVPSMRGCRPRGVPQYAKQFVKPDENAGCGWLIAGIFFAPLLVVAMIQSRPGSTTRKLAIAAFVLWICMVMGLFILPFAAILSLGR